MKLDEIKECVAKFLFLLGTMLIAMVIYYGIEGMIVERPVVVPINEPFTICNGYKIVKPGNAVCYKIHYFKRIDIPGDLTKQLIITAKDGKEYYLPLESTSGHLPAGEVEKLAFAKISDWSPEGIAHIKISSIHQTSKGPQFSTVITDKFEVRK
jgi:hypothetical protein